MPILTPSALRIGLAVLLLAACAATPEADPPNGDPCAELDPVLADAAFVIVTAPGQGQRLGSPFEVAGCSRTFESTVEWTLRARDGRVLAEGHTMGGGVDGAAPFRTSVRYDVAAPEVGSLHVAAPDPSDGEGPPPVRTVIPVVLAGSAR